MPQLPSKLLAILRGDGGEPPRHDLITWLFLRLLGALFVAAFVSFAVQAQGLIGSNGILPVHDYAALALDQLGSAAYWRIPMVFWLNDSDTAIQIVTWGGAFFAALLMIGQLERISLAVCYVFYLSLVHAGEIFMTFQWDFLLLETVVVAFILTFSQKHGIWLLRFLMFRFMLGAGLVKLASGEETWRNLTALYYHFETQPLPTPLAYYMHFLPHDVLRFLTFMTLVIELVMPFLVFLPRYFRFAAAVSFIGLQTVILLTGNYNFFNLTALALCLPLFDDQALEKILPRRFSWRLKERLRTIIPGRMGSAIIITAVCWIILISFIQFDLRFTRETPPILAEIQTIVTPYAMVNNYGPFSVMTRIRPEIIIEGSDDSVDWKEYSFRYKPGDVKRAAGWNIPHQPRLDWQMWFAALDTARNNPWFGRFLEKLLRNEPSVLDLMDGNPFPDKPPTYVRATLYEYHFATPEQRREEGVYWTRKRLGVYFPEARLNGSSD